MLTEMERQYSRLLIQGLADESIASELHVTKSAVRYYMRRIGQKIGTSNRVLLALKLQQYLGGE